MQCPVCKTTRCTPIELDKGLNAASCEKCGGHWISHENYSAWLKSHDESLPDKPFSEVEFDVHDVREAKLCPGCSRILLKYKVGHGLDFLVDHCPGCGGIWLDKDEWKALQSSNLHHEINKIFSTAWQKELRGDEMASKLDQAYTNRFGAETYQKAREIRDWLENQPQKRALLAFLSDDNPYKI